MKLKSGRWIGAGVGLVAMVVASSSVVAGSGITPGPSLDAGAIYITTGSFGGGGTLVRMQRRAPWRTRVLATLDSPDAQVQLFGGLLYVMESSTDTIRVFRRNGVELASIAVGAGTAPRDFLGVKATRAYVTRANATHLYRVDPTTGIGQDILDLSIFADADGIPEMERMITDGRRLFVQLRRIDNGGGSESAVPEPGGSIAVIDLSTETLIDADPLTAVIDPIRLVGPAPRLRMHLDREEDLLLVSATDGFHLSLGGGVERVRLSTLSSEGFVLPEKLLAALGGFVITEGTAGYFLFHTDIVASNHLKPFTVEGGAEPGPEIVVDLGIYLDALLYDRATRFLYSPASSGGAPAVDAGGWPPSGGVYVVDTRDDSVLTPSPVVLPGFPVDMVLDAAFCFTDLNADGVVGSADVVAMIEAMAQGDTVFDVDGDGRVGASDVGAVVADVGAICP